MTKPAEDPKSDPVTDTRLRGFVGYNMKRAFNALQADLVRTLEPFGLRMITYSALALIVENPGVRPSRLAEALSLKRANLVVIVDELEEREWVTRTVASGDRRAYALQCTLAGRKLFDEASTAVRRHDARMLQGLRDVEKAALRKALSHVEARGKGAG